MGSLRSDSGPLDFVIKVARLLCGAKMQPVTVGAWLLQVLKNSSWLLNRLRCQTVKMASVL